MIDTTRSNDIFDVMFEDFEEKVLLASADTPILVDLWAEWCSPCIVIAPVLKEIIKEYEGRVRLAKVEVDEGENMKIAGRYAARGFPTIMLFIEGEEVSRFSGAKPKSYIREFIDEFASGYIQ